MVRTLFDAFSSFADTPYHHNRPITMLTDISCSVCNIVIQIFTFIRLLIALTFFIALLCFSIVSPPNNSNANIFEILFKYLAYYVFFSYLLVKNGNMR